MSDFESLDDRCLSKTLPIIENDVIPILETVFGKFNSTLEKNFDKMVVVLTVITRAREIEFEYSYELIDDCPPWILDYVLLGITLQKLHLGGHL